MNNARRRRHVPPRGLHDPRATRVSEVMTAPVRTVSAQTPIEGAADIMATHRIRRLPVLEDGRLAGILTSSDIVRVYLDADRVIRQVVVKGSAARAGEE